MTVVRVYHWVKNKNANPTESGQKVKCLYNKSAQLQFLKTWTRSRVWKSQTTLLHEIPFHLLLLCPPSVNFLPDGLPFLGLGLTTSTESGSALFILVVQRLESRRDSRLNLKQSEARKMRIRVHEWIKSGNQRWWRNRIKRYEILVGCRAVVSKIFEEGP